MRLPQRSDDDEFNLTKYFVGESLRYAMLCNNRLYANNFPASQIFSILSVTSG